jgi:hypothetical protein
VSTIKVAFNGKPLFRWNGTAADMDGAMTYFEEFAADSGVAPDRLAQSTVKAIAANGGNFLPTKQPPQMWAVLYLFLDKPTGNPNFPGLFRDHLGYDFHIDIHSGDEEAHFDIQASWPAEGHA